MQLLQQKKKKKNIKINDKILNFVTFFNETHELYSKVTLEVARKPMRTVSVLRPLSSIQLGREVCGGGLVRFCIITRGDDPIKLPSQGGGGMLILLITNETMVQFLI